MEKNTGATMKTRYLNNCFIIGTGMLKQMKQKTLKFIEFKRLDFIN